MFSHINYEIGSTNIVANELSKRLEKNDFQLLDMDKGHGKTAVAIRTADLWAKKNDLKVAVIIIAPKSKLDEGAWEEYVRDYEERYTSNIYLEGQITPKKLEIAKKNDSKNLDGLNRLIAGKKQNGNQLSLKKIIEQIKEKPTLLIVDEVQMFKNPTTKRGKVLAELTKYCKTIGLSANPMANGMVSDGVNYLIMNNYYSSRNNFFATHIPKKHLDRFYKPNVLLENGDIDTNRFKDLSVFHNRILETVFRPNIPIDFDMPDKKTIIQKYQLSDGTCEIISELIKKQKKRYYDNYTNFLNDIRKAISVDINHARLLVKNLTYLKPVQPLIFYESIYDLQAIEFTLKKMNMNYSLINGENSIKSINKEDLEQAIVIQYRAGSQAIEFRKSNCTILYGLQYSWNDTDQALGRNVRRNEKHLVNQIFLVSNNEVDLSILNSLLDKKSMEEKEKEILAVDLIKNEM